MISKKRTYKVTLEFARKNYFIVTDLIVAE